MYIITGESVDQRVFSYALLEENEDRESLKFDNHLNNIVSYIFEVDEALDIMDHVIVITDTYKYQSKLN